MGNGVDSARILVALAPLMEPGEPAPWPDAAAVEAAFASFQDRQFHEADYRTWRDILNACTKSVRLWLAKQLTARDVLWCQCLVEESPATVERICARFHQLREQQGKA